MGFLSEFLTRSYRNLPNRTRPRNEGVGRTERFLELIFQLRYERTYLPTVPDFRLIERERKSNGMLLL